MTPSTVGHEQDVKVMLELYGDLTDTPEPQTDQDAIQKTDENTNKDTSSTQKIADETPNEPQKENDGPKNQIQKVQDSQNGSQKLLDAVRMNPKITKAALSGMLGVSCSTLKRWPKANNIVLVGHSKNGQWKIHKFH